MLRKAAMGILALFKRWTRTGAFAATLTLTACAGGQHVKGGYDFGRTTTIINPQLTEELKEETTKQDQQTLKKRLRDVRVEGQVTGSEAHLIVEDILKTIATGEKLPPEIIITVNLTTTNFQLEKTREVTLAIPSTDILAFLKKHGIEEGKEHDYLSIRHKTERRLWDFINVKMVEAAAKTLKKDTAILNKTP